MKVMRAKSSDKDQRDRVYDPVVLARLNQEQGRERLTSTEMEAVIALCAAKNLADDATNELKRLGRNRGFYRMLRGAVGMMKKAERIIGDSMTGEQLITVSNNTADCNIYVSSNSDPTVKQMMNVSADALMDIMNQSLRVCGLTCSCTREESKMCQLRRAYEQIPGVKKLARANFVAGNDCPYQMMEINEEAIV